MIERAPSYAQSILYKIGGEALPGGTSGLQIREGRLKLRLVGSTPTLLRQFFEWAGSTSWNKPY